MPDDRRDNDDDMIYEVVVNDEAQYSIWMAGRPVPNGWRTVGVRGPKAQCLDHIEQVWIDMRPRSLREAMAHPQQEPTESHT
jgi:MbtH protein